MFLYLLEIILNSTAIHAVDPMHKGTTDSSVLYIPVCPWTKDNLDYAQRQLKTFIAGSPSPDFGGGQGEQGFNGQVTLQDTRDLIGRIGQYSMGILDDENNSPIAEHGKRLYDQILKKATDAGTIDYSKWS